MEETECFKLNSISKLLKPKKCKVKQLHTNYKIGAESIKKLAVQYTGLA